MTIATSAYTERETAADIAAVASLLEMADRLGVLDLLQGGRPFTAAEIAAQAAILDESAVSYLEAMENAALVARAADGTYTSADDLADRIYESGYLSWVLNANRPFIDHVQEFLRDPVAARQKYLRDGRQVAVTSQWMGSYAFYPNVLATILGIQPSRVVDLGAGTARLLIEILLRIPEATAVALDIDGPACEAASHAAKLAGVAGRLTVTERSIQSVATDPSPVEGADVIHAGFVFHDMLPEYEDAFDGVLRNCRKALRPGGIMAITDAVPYLTNERERRFATMVSYYHKQFMGRRLLSEQEWTDKFRQAGFSDVQVVQHRFPSGRLFIASS